MLTIINIPAERRNNLVKEYYVLSVQRAYCCWGEEVPGRKDQPTTFLQHHICQETMVALKATKWNKGWRNLKCHLYQQEKFQHIL